MLYSLRPEFIYYFDPDLEIQTKIGKDRFGTSCIKIGFFEERMVKLINNFTLHFNFLFIITFFCFDAYFVNTNFENNILLCVYSKHMKIQCFLVWFTEL